MKYNVFIAGRLFGSFDNREKAENFLNYLKRSYLAMVHCTDSFYITEED